MNGGQIIVELGCGAGYTLDTLSQFYQLAIGFDIFITRLTQRSTPPASWQFVQVDLNQAFPLAADSVDAILANQVIEHILNPFDFAREINRVLRRGGHAVLTTPNVRYLRHLWRLVVQGHGPRTANHNTLDGEWDDGHLHYFTHRDLQDVFIQAGFREVTSRALIAQAGAMPGLRFLLDRFSGSYPVREFLSGNLLLVAKK